MTFGEGLSSSHTPRAYSYSFKKAETPRISAAPTNAAAFLCPQQTTSRLLQALIDANRGPAAYRPETGETVCTQTAPSFSFALGGSRQRLPSPPPDSRGFMSEEGLRGDEERCRPRSKSALILPERAGEEGTEAGKLRLFLQSRLGPGVYDADVWRRFALRTDSRVLEWQKLQKDDRGDPVVASDKRELCDLQEASKPIQKRASVFKYSEPLQGLSPPHTPEAKLKLPDRWDFQQIGERPHEVPKGGGMWFLGRDVEQAKVEGEEARRAYLKHKVAITHEKRPAVGQFDLFDSDRQRRDRAPVWDFGKPAGREGDEVGERAGEVDGDTLVLFPSDTPASPLRVSRWSQAEGYAEVWARELALCGKEEEGDVLALEPLLRPYKKRFPEIRIEKQVPREDQPVFVWQAKECRVSEKKGSQPISLPNRIEMRPSHAVMPIDQTACSMSPYRDPMGIPVMINLSRSYDPASGGQTNKRSPIQTQTTYVLPPQDTKPTPMRHGGVSQIRTCSEDCSACRRAAPLLYPRMIQK
uniref:Uncharacterized protein n=1 Tax=Chromera velia CCMP2878 TaxID=1169474 RepID=A0A0G4IB10_9ALVE|eukprot:Cvel_12603.t1-p1 / transcript=Cvel_12603.t1 / gene=Cvel_12603 / organism=Chromera_velia_CCMP2878 / gene_product=hypothetical protein / transcript_product=hypothetical protein / location=Cvel_scaffold831:61177-62754(-) / protein_length=526 / sequence_SO=supercontig / SO=protein_coding / is_pseudo=false